MKMLVAFIGLCFATSTFAASEYLVGQGMHDITGPVADIMMMGYVKFKQMTQGLHTRLRARAFIVANPESGRRVVLANIDQIHVYEAVTQKVIEKLRNDFGDLYTEKNVLIECTHTHSAPGGFSHYKLYYLANKGFSQQNFDVIVEGIYQSIKQAHQNLAPGSIRFNEGELVDLGVNRSPDSYLMNPPEERARYAHNTDKTFSVLRFDREGGKELGVIAWFALHATSVKSDNQLVSSDNKGFAAYLFEKAKGTQYFSSDTFVASFPNGTAGDVSPSDGPGFIRQDEWDCYLQDNFKCNQDRGEKQYHKARELYDSASVVVSGPIDYRHVFVDMSNELVDSSFTGTHQERTCYGAIGLSMLAGTKDGKGYGVEGQRCSDPSVAGEVLCNLHKDCHGEKPVTLAMGLKEPYPWSPQILPIQILRIGQLAFVSLPGEFTTMSGRRIRENVRAILSRVGVTQVVMAGYANGYAGYVSTPEEYQVQNYEGASTHFGRWTLSAYQQEFSRLAMSMVEGTELSPGPAPLDLTNVSRLQAPFQSPKFDSVPSGKSFGSLVSDVSRGYHRGDIASVSFWGGYPNRNLQIQSSYLEVQKQVGNGWHTIAYDWDAETKLRYEKIGKTQARLTIEWEIPQYTEAGVYRIFHRGSWRSRDGLMQNYSGVSSEFTVQ